MISTCQTRRKGRARERGAALVELALVVPLLVTLLMFSVFITDLVRVKLKLQEAARYVGFEMTSYVLTDFGSGDHDKAFNEAMTRTVHEAQDRYKDLDSIEDDAGSSSQVFDYQPLTATVQNLDAPLINRPFSVGGGGLFASLLTRLNGGLNGSLSLWGFNPKGRVQAQVAMTVTNRFLPKDLSEHDGASLASVHLTDRYTLTATGWYLPDGADQTVTGKTGIAGDHNLDSDGRPGGLWTQVDRMTYGGLKHGAEGLIPGIDRLEFLPLVPHVFGTYVVSHNYMEPARPERRNCNVSSRRGGFNGLHNLAADTHPGAGDHPRLLKDGSEGDTQMRCFDTAPFRDTESIDDSLYAQIYEARGEYFMGCQNPMADDPTLNDTYPADEMKAKASCQKTPP